MSTVATETDLDVVAEALASAPEVSASTLVAMVSHGHRTVVITRAVGAAAFDLDPDYVTVGRARIADLPHTDSDWEAAARSVAHIIIRLIRERGLMCDYQHCDSSWHPVPVLAVGDTGGYGIDAGNYTYRISRTWTAQQCGEYWGYTSRAASSYRARVAEGTAPPALPGYDPVTGLKMWDVAAVRAAWSARPGRGARYRVQSGSILSSERL